MLDLMRSGAASSELNEEETSQRLLELLSKPRRFEKLAAVVAVEPPRVVAVLGAAGQELGKRPAQLRKLRELLNPPLIEKDYFVTEALRCISHAAFERVIFNI